MANTTGGERPCGLGLTDLPGSGREEAVETESSDGRSPRLAPTAGTGGEGGAVLASVISGRGPAGRSLRAWLKYVARHPAPDATNARTRSSSVGYARSALSRATSSAAPERHRPRTPRRQSSPARFSSHAKTYVR